MNIKVANTGGFCMGVNRALNIVLDIIDKGGEVTTYGPLIHNRHVIEMLENRGVYAQTDYSKITSGKIIIRAHGAPISEIEELKSHGFQIIDGTCPRVKSSHNKIRWAAARDAQIIIAGDHNHDEVIGLQGQAEGRCIVVSSLEEFEAIESHDRFVVLLAQTTFSTVEYEKIKQEFLARFKKSKIFDTICSATFKRQEDVLFLAKSCDAIIVVGGYNSANTCRLAEIAISANVPTFQIESKNDIEKEKIKQFETVGVTGGASTPPWIIKEVVRFLSAL